LILRKGKFMDASLFTRFFDVCVLRSWWVILFINLCYIGYEQGQYKRKNLYAILNNQMQTLEEEKEKALALRKRLMMQKNNQHDPAWIELTLMKEMGMVPEGYQKFLFSEKN